MYSVRCRADLIQTRLSIAKQGKMVENSEMYGRHYFIEPTSMWGLVGGTWGGSRDRTVELLHAFNLMQYFTIIVIKYLNSEVLDNWTLKPLEKTPSFINCPSESPWKMKIKTTTIRRIPSMYQKAVMCQIGIMEQSEKISSTPTSLGGQ